LKGQAQRDLIRDLVSEATNARFEIIERAEDGSFPVKGVEWFMRCRNEEDIRKTPYLNTVWKERDGPVWMESLAIGDTFDWIGSSYGEETAGNTLDLNYSEFAEKRFRSQFNAKYPLVQRRIQSCETIAVEAGRRHRVHLELRSIGSKGIVVFTLSARLSALEKASLAKRVKSSVTALREAYEQVTQI